MLLTVWQGYRVRLSQPSGAFTFVLQDSDVVRFRSQPAAGGEARGLVRVSDFGYHAPPCARLTLEQVLPAKSQESSRPGLRAHVEAVTPPSEPPRFAQSRAWRRA